MILLPTRLRLLGQESTRAHELGHAFYDDDTDGDPQLGRHADQFAVRILITPTKYLLDETPHNRHPGAITYELGVLHPLYHLENLYERKQTEWASTKQSKRLPPKCAN
ncbi:ImmA/IrrE family metallo-endopeptidase [Corynebacterium ulcerans]|uniref:ImmA/IrrE family metallo-endopeptidase n=1 Tax=Corynebacterium ulcerans TaxID=65058 RepID=UPI0035AB90F7